MNTTLDDLYLEWLYSQVASIDQKARSKTYWSLLRQLYTKEFVWIVPNDDNRVEDGRDLRFEFIHSLDLEDVDPQWLHLGCSVLEMLIALSRRLSFEGDGPAEDWFWILLKNIELDQCTDARYKSQMHAYVDDILDRIIWRTYNDNGRGGLFPLRDARQDQREVEIWYQLSAYLMQDD